MKPTPLHPCDTAQASMLHDANACKDRGTELFMKEKYELAAAEYFDGIMILVKGQRGADILDLVTTLRSNRSACFLQLARTSCSGPAQIISWAREAARDATAVLDMPKHASPVLLLKARLRRASATGIILQHEGSDVEATIEQTSADAAQVLHSPLASGDQKKQARELQEMLRQLSPFGSSMPKRSILGAFLTLEQLAQPTALRVGCIDEPTLKIVKSFMDKPGPVNMADGTRKDGAENAEASKMLDDLVPACRTCSEEDWNRSGRQHLLTNMTNLFGAGSGTYFGEVLFWRMRRGELLGKQKWETGVFLQEDVGTLGELWDMRWVFPSADAASGFHLDMLAASRAEAGSGYLEGPECIEMPFPPDASLGRLNRPVLFQNRPRKRPQNLMRSMEVLSSPVSFTQQYGIVFTVDRVVVKMTAYGGLCARHELKCTALLELAEVAAQGICAWLDPSQVAPSPRRSPKRLALPSVGLHGLSTTEGFVRSFHAHASSLREYAPWEVLGTHHHLFRLGATHLGASDHVVQLLGSSGRHIGVQVWPSFTSFVANKRSGALPFGLLVVEFLDQVEHAAVLADEVELAQRCKASLSTVHDPLRRHFPLLMRGDNEPDTPLRMNDACIAEAAMAMAVTFFAERVCTKPVPSPPHPISYNFEPCEATSLPYTSGAGSGEPITLECSPRFPAGEFAMCDRPWSSYPALVKSMATRPAGVITIGEAVAFHRNALVSLGPLIRVRVRVLGVHSRPELNGKSGMVVSFTDSGRYLVQMEPVPGATSLSTPVSLRASSVEPDPEDASAHAPATSAPAASEFRASERWRAHSFGLANALWELETLEDVAEACTLGERLWADRPNMAVGIFLLDLYLEQGSWSSALGLLQRLKLVGTTDAVQGMDAVSLEVTLAWTAALIRLKKFGYDSETGAKAVCSAIGVNPHVFPILVRDVPMPEKDDVSEGPYAFRYLPDGRRYSPEADKACAIQYLLNFRKHWWVAAGSGNELLRAVRLAGEEAHREVVERWNAVMATAVLGKTSGMAGARTMPKLPSEQTSVCAHCKCICQAKMCGRCGQVGYCSPECQKAHWKDCHKHACGQAKSKD